MHSFEVHTQLLIIQESPFNSLIFKSEKPYKFRNNYIIIT